MITTSPSELVTADDCGRAHHFKYIERLRLKDATRSPTLASGVAVHAVIEEWCRDHGGQVPGVADLGTRAEAALSDEFAHDYDGGGKNLKKFLPGVLRALKRVPEWVWLEPAWNVEWDIDGFFGIELIVPEGVPESPYEQPHVYLHGRPDMWRLVDDEAPSIQILDTKTTDNDPLDFLLWTPQVRMYAAIFKQMYPDRLITYQYMCLPTKTGNSPAPYSPSWVLTNAGAEKVEAEILVYASKLGGTDPRYSRNCKWCDYAPICKSIITGADPAGITQELYQVRERRT